MSYSLASLYYAFAISSPPVNFVPGLSRAVYAVIEIKAHLWSSFLSTRSVQPAGGSMSTNLVMNTGTIAGAGCTLIFDSAAEIQIFRLVPLKAICLQMVFLSRDFSTWGSFFAPEPVFKEWPEWVSGFVFTASWVLGLEYIWYSENDDRTRKWSWDIPTYLMATLRWF